MNERIRELRNELGLTQEEFCKKIGITRSNLAGYETNRINPSNGVILSICREYNVNEDWLRHGSGKMFIPAPNDEVEALARKHDLPDLAKSLIKEFANLPPSDMGIVLDFIMRAVEETMPRENGATLSFNPSDYRMFKAAKKKDGITGEGDTQTYQSLEDAPED